MQRLSHKRVECVGVFELIRLVWVTIDCAANPRLCSDSIEGCVVDDGDSDDHGMLIEM